MHYATRQAFVSLKSSNKIKLALKKNICNYQQFYETNVMVYYKRKNSPEWKDPAKVLGQDGPALFLRQGTRYIKAYVCRVQSIESPSIQYTNPENSQRNSNNTHNIDNQDKQQLLSKQIKTTMNLVMKKVLLQYQILKNKPMLVIIQPILYQQTIKNKMKELNYNNNDYATEIISRAGKSTGK